jgi:hypothetical protein
MNEPAPDALATTPTPMSEQFDERSRARRIESALLIALAIAGAVLEYPLMFALLTKAPKQSELLSKLPFLAVTIVLAAIIPSALKWNSRLGLPGAPLVEAKISGQPIRSNFRDLLRISFSYAIFAASIGALDLFLVLVPVLLLRHGKGGSLLPVSPLMNVAPGRLAIVGAMVAVVAAISEEIQFRLVLYAVLGWLWRMTTRDSTHHPGWRALWVITLVQGYLFGLVHLIPVIVMIPHRRLLLMLGALLMPQTWEGVVFGRLYLRRGLEAAMLAHAIMDLSLFALASILGSHFR